MIRKQNEPLVWGLSGWASSAWGHQTLPLILAVRTGGLEQNKQTKKQINNRHFCFMSVHFSFQWSCYHDDKSINSNLNVNKIILTQMIIVSYSGIVHLILELFCNIWRAVMWFCGSYVVFLCDPDRVHVVLFVIQFGFLKFVVWWRVLCGFCALCYVVVW